ncbi:MAG TPA: Ppx/GppA family phosphatase, partial [Dongiaceae bacterium]|nr:Ppx/GppA family phosphatase [Dongiaceae bacterium]
WLSIPIGVVTLSERYGSARMPPEIYESMVAEVVALLRPFEAANGIAADIAAGAVQMIGSSGTVTTLAGIHLGLPRYDRRVVDGCDLDFSEIRAVSRSLAAMSCDERAANGCVGRERADLVVAGCAILEAICSLWPVGRVRVADRGVREGILLGLMHSVATAAGGRRAGAGPGGRSHP